MIRELLHKMKKPDGKRRFGFRFGVLAAVRGNAGGWSEGGSTG